MQPNQQVTFLTDGGEDVRDLPLYLNRQAEHCLDWLCPCQRELHPELWGEISEWGDHLECVRGVRRQPGGEQTDGQEATDALDARGRSPSPTGPHPHAQPRVGGNLPRVVPESHFGRPGHPSRVATGGRVAPNLKRSPHSLAGGFRADVPNTRTVPYPSQLTLGGSSPFGYC
jgi:hypothetical protein